ncbi:MAG: hypothetical protein ACXWHF_00430 [Chthoniobacterales bacterium]
MKTIQHRSGSSLLVVMFALAIVIIIAGIAAEYTTTVNRFVKRTATLQTARTVADASIEQMFTNWRAICRATPTTPLPTTSFTSIPLPTYSQLNLPTVSKFAKAGTQADLSDEYDPTYTVSNVKIVAVDGTLQPLAGAGTAPSPAIGMAQTGVINTTSASYNYVASADVTLPTPSGNVVAKVRRVFSKQQMSPWNWAIFYVDPLEIHPGPLFTVTGWVHTNSNLYTAHNTLTFADKVTYASDWLISFMPGDGQHSETPVAPNWPSNLPPARDTALQPFGMDSTSIFNTGDPNPNNDSYHELIEVPAAGYSDPMSSSRYWNQASVAIKIDGSNNVTIGQPNSDGTITAFATTNPLYQMFSGAITTNQTIQDNREAANVRLVTLDISKIENGTSTLSPSFKAGAFNGIVFIYDSSATSTTRRGVRLLNGSKVPSSGLTVASSNPVYIKGDFNTGGSPPSNANPSDPTAPQVSGYTRAPCAVIADAVNILSNSWNDANSSAGTSSRVASNTTVNTAILAGIVPTAPPGGDGSYSGGAENFPRFLEDWSSSILTYYGSMVELYQSKQSVGEWGKGNVYSPPTRHWYFDSNFKVRPPPGSLMVYSYVKGKWSVL